EFIGGLVHKVAGKVLRIANKAPPGNALFAGSLLRSAIARKGQRFDEFIVLLVRLVLVGLKIGGNGPFGGRLGGFFAEIALAKSEDELVDATGLQVAQRRPRNFSQGGGVKLLALPCPHEEQPGGLQPRGRVDEGQFERLPGELATFCQTSEEAASELIKFADAALNGVALFEEIGDKSIFREHDNGSGFQRDLHDSFIASGCDTSLALLPCGHPCYVRPGGGPTTFCPGPARFRPWQCRCGNKCARE